MLKIVTQEIDDFGAKDGSGTTQVDIVDEFAYPFPVTVICGLLGVPAMTNRDSRHCPTRSSSAEPTTGGLAERRRRARKAVADFNQYFAELLDARDGQLGDDLLSGLISGDGASADATRRVLSNATLLLIAGHETTVNLITNGMLTLLRHPEVLDRLRRGDEPIWPPGHRGTPAL